MRTFSLVVLAALAAAPLSATDTTRELLTAPWVRERLVFQVTQDGRLQARRDGDTTYVDIADGSPFVLSEQRDLVFHDFNPFLYAIRTEETTEKDPNYTSIARFLEALQSTETAIEHMALPKFATPSACKAYDDLQEKLFALDALLREQPLTAKQFARWTQSATSADGVASVRGEIRQSIADLQQSVRRLTAADAEISRFIPEAGENEPQCSEVKASTFALVYVITRTFDSNLQARKNLIADLQALNASLEKFADRTAWREDAKNDYIFYKPVPDFQTIKTLNISVKPRTFSITDGALSIAEGKGVTRSIRLRAYSRFVPEIAAGFIHTGLEYPKYGTKDEGGKTVVARAGTDTLPAQGAVLLNLVCRCWGASVVYPALQLGVTNSKQYPGFLAGAGVRFTAKYSFSLVAGWVVTWFEDLDGLKVGDAVSGTADVQSHLKRRRAPAKSYIGVQYNF